MNELKFFIAGTKFRKEENPLQFKDAEVDILEAYNDSSAYVTFKPQPDNTFDPCAVMIYLGGLTDDHFMGYVPKTVSAQVSALLEVEDVLSINLTIHDTPKLYQKYEIAIEWE